MLRTYLARFVVVIVAVPLVFLAVAWAATFAERTVEGPAAVAAAVTFAAVALAPSTGSAIVRAALAILTAAMALAVAWLT